MTTSGTYVKTFTRQELINSSFRLVGVGVQGENLSSEDMANGVLACQMLLKHMTTQGLHLWKRQWIVVFMAEDQVRYRLGPGGDRACFEASLTATTIGANEATGQTVLTLTSSAGMTAGDNIGIVLDDGSLFWTTIVSVDDATTVTVTNAITDAASAGAQVFSYPTTAVIPRPSRLANGFTRVWNVNVANNDTEMLMISEQEYRILGNKNAQGRQNQYYYTPALGQGAYDVATAKGDLYVYSQPNNTAYTSHFSAEIPVQNVDTDSADFDIPPEWFRALRYWLARDLAMEYGYPVSNMSQLSALAEQALDDVLGWDQEPASLLLQPDLTRMGAWR
jgi:hypothetical protein